MLAGEGTLKWSVPQGIPPAVEGEREALMNLLERVGLVGHRELLPPDDRYPGDEYYDVVGILPMLWLWATDVASFAAVELGTTVQVLADDHAWVRRVVRAGSRVWP